MISKENLKLLVYFGIGVGAVVVGVLVTDLVIKPYINRAKAPSLPALKS